MKRKYILAILFLIITVFFCGTSTATEINGTTDSQSNTLTDTSSPTQSTQDNSIKTNTQTPDTQTTSSIQVKSSKNIQISGNSQSNNIVVTNPQQTTIQGGIYQSTTFPTNYDLRTLGKVTPVKYQGTAGTCCVFATYGSLESCLLPYENNDFSENNMKDLLSSSYTNGFDRNWSDGVNYKWALAYLARWSGPVKESQDPYNDSSGISPTNLSPVKHIQNALNLPKRTGPLDNNNIKLALMNYGAVATSMYHDDTFYNSVTHSYYYNNPTISPNHCIDIVGWDDNYSSDNFKTHPPGNGAFIIRNSWGTWWGENGYFYISYYNTQLGEFWVFNNAEPTSNYNKIYQYDPLGWISQTGYKNETGWFSNVFTSTGNDKLAAASFYALSPNSNYELYVYLNPTTDNPRSGTLAATKTGTLNLGYWTIKLDTPIKLITGQIFSVVVKLTSPGMEYPIANECYGSYSSQASSGPKQSYISYNGINWSDYTKYDTSANVCLKAFTIPYIKVTSIDPTNKATNVPLNKIINITFSEPIKAGSMWIDLKNSAGTLITYTTNITGKVLTIKPTNLLSEDKYTLTLHTGSITDLASNPLALWGSTFSVGTSPTITSFDPTNNAINVARNKVISITFSEPVKWGSKWIDIKANGVTRPSTSYTMSLSSTGKTLTITPLSFWATNTKYTLVFHTGCVNDYAGNPIKLTSKSFTTTNDSTAPTIKTPASGTTTNIARTQSMTITFSEPVKWVSKWIDIKANGLTIPSSSYTLSLSSDGKTLTIKPTTSWAANTTYAVILHTGCITDLAGNNLALTSRSFKTGST